ncbi:MAG: hypothetical protein EPO53_03125, partial [Variovorax sp.]
RAPQVARSEAEGHRQRGRLSLLTFFGETKKVSRPPGRDPAYALRKENTLQLTPAQDNKTKNAPPPCPQAPNKGKSQSTGTSPLPPLALCTPPPTMHSTPRTEASASAARNRQGEPG